MSELYSDLHKDVYGFRPRGPFSFTPTQMEEEMERLSAELRTQMRSQLNEDSRAASIAGVPLAVWREMEIYDAGEFDEHERLFYFPALAAHRGWGLG